VSNDLQGSQAAGAPDQFPLLTEGETSQNLGSAGVDRISLSFPVADFDRDERSWWRVSTTAVGGPNEARQFSQNVSLGPGQPKVFVGVSDVAAARGLWGKVELNPSRVVNPDGWELASTAEVRGAVMDAVVAALPMLTPATENVGEFRVKRLDVARDFQTSHGEFYVRGLAPVHRAWARRNLVHFDPARKGAQTLMVGSGTGVVRLYDKEAETGGQAPPGTLRFEAECRSAWCSNYAGIDCLDDVTDSNVDQLARNRWEWSGMGTDVAAMERVVEVAKRSGLSPRELCSFLGYVTLLANGSGRVVSKNTATKYRRMARSLGVSISELEESSARFLGRLDWDQGCEVLHAEAA
jgi:hypothetical protein